MKDRRNIPSVNKIIEEEAVASFEDLPRKLVVTSIQNALERCRRGTEEIHKAYVMKEVLLELQSNRKKMIQGVINGTGVLLHTNLGRAPLPATSLSLLKAALGYCNLEYDLEKGQRGDRYQSMQPLLKLLTGAEDTLVVNNNAAAVLLTLRALAKDKEVLVSRGELVEIGGGFRVPEVIKESGCILKEVGTTNRTKIKDYEEAITENSRVLLKVHPSNYHMIGFTEHPSREELRILAKKKNLVFVEDLGSGSLLDLPQETKVKDCMPFVDVLTFSGDKLLGGPQAGMIAGKKEYLDRIRKTPLLRAMRIDKLSLLALQGVLIHYLSEDFSALPLYRMLKTPLKELEERGSTYLAALGPNLTGELLVTQATTGGGTIPGQTFDSLGVLFTGVPSANKLEAHFRKAYPPVIGRTSKEGFVLDLMTIFPEQDTLMMDLLRKGVE